MEISEIKHLMEHGNYARAFHKLIEVKQVFLEKKDKEKCTDRNDFM